MIAGLCLQISIERLECFHREYLDNDLEANKMKEQYRKLLDQVFTGNGEGIGNSLYEILPTWESKIFVGAVILLYDREELRNNDNEAASLLISMPRALRSGAILCGSNGAQAEAKHLMKLSEQLAEELEQARASANIGKEQLEKITRILVAFDCAKHHKESVKGRIKPVHLK